MATDIKVIVIGGGIGGMTLAHGLAREGMQVRVIEASHRTDQQGTGINLMGNALRALDLFGLADVCIAKGYGWDMVCNHDADGRVLSEFASSRTFRPDAPSAVGIMRPKLAEILEAHALASGAVINYRTTVESIEQDADGVMVRLSSGETDRCDLLVAADGVYSKTREAIFGPQYKPTYVGQGCWRYTVERSDKVNGLMLYHGEDRHTVGALPLSPELCYYFVLENSVERPHMPPERLGEMFKERLAGFGAPEIREAIDRFDGTRYISFRPFDALLMPQPWYKGRVVLLGDAAHSVTPQLTSGGGMAIEDAVVLTQELAASRSVPQALAAYCERRGPRVQRIFENTLAICRAEQDPNTHGEVSMRLIREGYAILAEPF